MTDHGPAEGSPAQQGAEAARWARLADARDAKAAAEAWLDLLLARIDGATGGLVAVPVARRGAPVRGEWQLLAVVGGAEEDAEPFLRVARESAEQRTGLAHVTGGEPSTEPDAPARFAVSELLRRRGEICGAIVVEVEQTRASELPRVKRELQWAGPGIAARLEEVQRRPALLGEPAAWVVDWLAATLQETRADAALKALVGELASATRCERVSIGISHGGRTRVAALSQSAHVGSEMALVRAIEAALDESLDQAAALTWPDAGEAHRILRAHEILARDHGGGRVWTWPLRDGDEWVGALCLEGPDPGGEETQVRAALDTAAALLGPILSLLLRDDRPIWRKLSAAAAAELSRWIGPRHLGRKLTALVVGLVALFFAVADGTYRVHADATLEGAERRVIVAPFDGYVAAAERRAGERVDAGALLAALDDRELQLDRLKWQSRRVQLLRQRDDARAERDRAALAVAQAQIEEADAEIARIDGRIARTQLRAPLTGLVVEGDLSQQLGAAVARGDELFVVSPEEGWRVILRVDETQIDDVREEQRGQLVLAALPGASLPFTVRRVTPVSSAGEGANRFRVEATLENADARLRPGMAGIGKVEIGERALGWIWARGLIRWLQLRWWAFWP